MKICRSFPSVALLSCLPALLSACGGVNLWPFESEKGQPLSRVPANAAAYQCDEGKRLFLRFQDGGGSVWVILPEREFRLDRVGSNGSTRYSNGKATLQTEPGAATLADGPALQFNGCKPAAG